MPRGALGPARAMSVGGTGRGARLDTPVTRYEAGVHLAPLILRLPEPPKIVCRT